jgi:hypothetical protein
VTGEPAVDISTWELPNCRSALADRAFGILIIVATTWRETAVLHSSKIIGRRRSVASIDVRLASAECRIGRG